MSDVVLDRVERLAEALSKFEGILDKIPRVAEMLGVAYFAGKASERLGGPFDLGALGGVVADGLAHSQVPNNQIGGIALAAYFTSIGLLNMLPNGPPTVPPLKDDSAIVGAGGTVLDPANVYSGLGPTERIMDSAQECLQVGGTVVRHFTRSALVVCSIPPAEITPVVLDPITRRPPGGIRR